MNGLTSRSTTRDSTPEMGPIQCRNIFYPLPEGLHSRLVRVLPGSWPDPICIELIQFSLEPGEVPFYEAASYVWGDPTNQKSISCSGQAMMVSPSVEALIRRFRLADVARYFPLHVSQISDTG